MPSAAEISQVCDIFCSLLRNRDVRLEHGSRLREKMYEQVANGERPDGYRPDWVRSSTMQMLRELHRIALAFNETHPNDQCSAGDLIDILTTAVNCVKNGAGEGD